MLEESKLNYGYRDHGWKVNVEICGGFILLPSPLYPLPSLVSTSTEEFPWRSYAEGLERVIIGYDPVWKIQWRD